MSDTILQLRDIVKDFSGVEVLHGVSVDIKRASVHAFVGENGAGKSTLVKILCGFYPFGEYSGEVILNGNPARFTGIKEAARAGIEFISQELELVGSLAVYENIYLGNEKSNGLFLDKYGMIRGAKDVFKRFGLDISPVVKVDDLGIGQQQMVAIAKALSRDANILIFDEPTAALSEAEAERLFDIIRDLKSKGITILYISHRLGEVLALSDTITVIRDGYSIITSDTETFTEDNLISHMVGRTIQDRFPKRQAKKGNVMLKVSGLTSIDPSGKTRVNAASFEVHAGEVLGFAGLMGAGRTELVTSIFGAFDGTVVGKIELDGVPIRIKNPRVAIKNGIGLVPEDRKSDGLVLCLDLLNNISMASLKEISPKGFIRQGEEMSNVNDLVQKLSIRAPSPFTILERLSGGNQQKVSVSKMLTTKPKVLILDEPTRGVDVGAKYEIYTIINRLAKDGVAIIIVSSELPEVLGISDRVLVMKAGKIMADLTKEEATQKKVMYYATLEEKKEDD